MDQVDHPDSTFELAFEQGQTIQELLAIKLMAVDALVC